jgi:hypothetical protein
VKVFFNILEVASLSSGNTMFVWFLKRFIVPSSMPYSMLK